METKSATIFKAVGYNPAQTAAQTVQQTAKIVAEQPRSLKSRISSAAYTAFGYLEKTKKVADKTLSPAKKFLKIGETAGPRRLASKVGKIGTKLKFFSAIIIPFNAIDLGREVYSIPKSLIIRDWEALGLTATAIGVIIGDTIDAAATLTDALVSLDSNPALAFLSQALVPLGIALVSTSTAIKTYRLAITGVQLHKLNKMLKNAKTDEELVDYVNNLIGITEKDHKRIEFKLSRKNLSPEEYYKQFDKEVARLKKLKTSRLQRRANGKVAKLLSDIVDDPEKLNNPAELQNALKQLKKALIKTTCVNSAEIIANLITLTGLILFFAPVPPVAPFVLLALGATFKLGIFVCDEFIITDSRLMRLGEKKNGKPITLPEPVQS